MEPNEPSSRVLAKSHLQRYIMLTWDNVCYLLTEFWKHLCYLLAEIWEHLCFLAAVTGSIGWACLLWVMPRHYRDIADDIVLITGGGRGVGRQLAVEFAKKRPKQIVLWGRTEDALRATCQAVRCHDVACSYMVCDITDRKQVYAKAEEVRSTIGTVTILVNNAGVVYGENILESCDEDILSTFNTNTISHFWTVKAFLPAMMEQDHGYVVTISSLLGHMGLVGVADYSATKFATVGFTETLNLEIKKQKKEDVHVTSVYPYLINTDMFAGIVPSRYDWLFRLLFPALDKEYVAWKTVDVTLRGQAMCIMPRAMYLLLILKAILPVETMVLVHQHLGMDESMDNFHGRQKKD